MSSVNSSQGGLSTRASSARGWPSYSRLRRNSRGSVSEPPPEIRVVSPNEPIEVQKIQVPTLRGVSIWDVLGEHDQMSIQTRSTSRVGEQHDVRRIDEDFFTPNVEELLKGLSGPLKVVHNVATSEVRRHLKVWKPSAVDEVSALEGMEGINRLRGKKAKDAMARPGVQVLPAKTVFTVKPGKGDSWFRRKCRVVGCGNFEKASPGQELFAGGVPADVLRACLIQASHMKFAAWITDIKNAFLLAPLPCESQGRILLRPPKILEELGITESDEIWEITRAVYGLRQSPRWWSTYRDNVLRQAEWESENGRIHLSQSPVETNLWLIVIEGGAIVGFMIVYVDDLMILSTSSVAHQVYNWIQGEVAMYTTRACNE